jgi:hypothetical protein
MLIDKGLIQSLNFLIAFSEALCFIVQGYEEWKFDKGEIED